MPISARVSRLWGYVSLGALLITLSACSGLSDEPKIVATLPPPTPSTVPPSAITPSATSVVTSVATSVVTSVAIVQAAQPAAAATQATAQASAPSGTQEASGISGTVSGSVSNGTAGATVPANLAVTLHIMDQDSNETTASATADAAGNFTFKDVPIRADRAYAVTATYLERLFGSEFVRGDPASPSISLPFKVYEVTGSADMISISGMTTRINVSGDGLEVAQITRFRNKSDRVYSSEKPNDKGQYTSVSISLPPGASIMGFSDSETRYTIAPDGSTVTDSAPVVPGEDHVIHVVYTLPYRDGMTVEQPLRYPVEGNVQLLVSPETISANSQQFPGIGLQTQQGVSVKAYGGATTLPAGSVMRYQLTGTAPVSPTSTTAQGGLLSRELIVGLLIGLGIGIIFVGLFFLVRERIVSRREDGQSAQQRRIDDLVGQLARLDDEHTTGVIGKSAYAKRRRRLKLQLAKLMKG